jgi:hypothetical protein
MPSLACKGAKSQKKLVQRDQTSIPFFRRPSSFSVGATDASFSAEDMMLGYLPVCRGFLDGICVERLEHALSDLTFWRCIDFARADKLT